MTPNITPMGRIRPLPGKGSAMNVAERAERESSSAERAPLGLLVRMSTIGGAENGAYSSYLPIARSGDGHPPGDGLL